MLDEEPIKQGSIFLLTKPFESDAINDRKVITGS